MIKSRAQSSNVTDEHVTRLWFPVVTPLLYHLAVKVYLTQELPY